MSLDPYFSQIIYELNYSIVDDTRSELFKSWLQLYQKALINQEPSQGHCDWDSMAAKTIVDIGMLKGCKYQTQKHFELFRYYYN